MFSDFSNRFLDSLVFGDEGAMFLRMIRNDLSSKRASRTKDLSRVSSNHLSSVMMSHVKYTDLPDGGMKLNFALYMERRS
jgi:hypothetical protein